MLKKCFEGVQASRLREKGDYSRDTLRLFLLAWQKSKSGNSLVDWVSYQRDLGFPIKRYQYLLLQKKLRPLWLKYVQPGFDFKKIRLGKALCAEYEFQSGLELSFPKECFWQLWRHEAKWQEEFVCGLIQDAHKGIAIVGNGNHLKGTHLGKEIDSCHTVLRFNYFHGPSSTIEDQGAKVSVWVRAPDYKGPAPDVSWLLLSGPAMHFKIRNWQPIKPLLANGTKLVSIPLWVWRDLVAKLSAPPSSGMLVSYWLAQHSSLKPYIKLYGFGYNPDSGSVYHQGLRSHLPNPRHNWAGEARLLAGLLSN